MINNFKKHFWYYMSFLVFQSLGFFLVVFTIYNKQLHLEFIILTTAFYIFWSLLHQYIHHNITTKIVVEYVLIGCLGFTLSLLIFNF